MAVEDRFTMTKLLRGDDEKWMIAALDQARLAAERGEVPVGAVAIVGAAQVAADGNRVIEKNDPTAHAEMNVLRAAAASHGNYRLEDIDLFVTVEPCCMCAGALVAARVRRVVYGAREPKTGACGSVFDVLNAPQHTHRPLVHGGVLADQASRLLRAFFGERR